MEMEDSASLTLLVKLGSIIVHFDEYNSPDGRNIDLDQAKKLLQDPEVEEWMKKMTRASFLPLKRCFR